MVGSVNTHWSLEGDVSTKLKLDCSTCRRKYRYREVIMTSALHAIREKQTCIVKMRDTCYPEIGIRCIPRCALSRSVQSFDFARQYYVLAKTMHR